MKRVGAAFQDLEPRGCLGESEPDPGTSVVRISHPGEELPAVGPWEAAGSALPAPREAEEGDGARSPSGGGSRDCAAAVPRTPTFWMAPAGGGRVLPTYPATSGLLRVPQPALPLSSRPI